MGRKKREIKNYWEEVSEFASALVHGGLEEFEEKIDKIADGEDDGENSWISKIYNHFSFFNGEDNSLSETDLDGLEPPLLDETWEVKATKGHLKADITANTTVGEAVLLKEEEMEIMKTKREVEDEVTEDKTEDTEDK